MKKRKNDYSCIVFNKNQMLVKVTYVHNLRSLVNWLATSRNYNSWTYFNCYNRRTGVFIGRFYRGDFIPSFP